MHQQIRITQLNNVSLLQFFIMAMVICPLFASIYFNYSPRLRPQGVTNYCSKCIIETMKMIYREHDEYNNCHELKFISDLVKSPSREIRV